MLMPVYQNAINASKTGDTQYVIERSLDIFCTGNKNSALRYLSDGWDLKAVCNNGVLECTWRLNAMIVAAAKNYDVYLRIAQLLGLPKDKCMIRINTQEFYDYAGEPEAVYMYLDVWKLNDPKPQTIWITPKDTKSPDFVAGQEKAKAILDILLVYGVKQDKEPVIRDLQQKLAKEV